MILSRIKEFIDSKGISISAFEKSIGVANASFGKPLKVGGNIGSDKLENILSIYTDLNPIWLMTGEGNMLISSNVHDKNAYPNAYQDAYLSPKSENESEDKDANLPQKERLIKETVSNEVPLRRQYSIGEHEPVLSTKEIVLSTQPNELIKDLIDQLKEQSEEIGALKQENASLKHRLAQYAEAAQDAQSARA